MPQPAGPPRGRLRPRTAVVVLDQITGEQVARLASPGAWIRGRIWSAAWEDRAHLLVSFQRDHGLETTILRVDVRSGDWSLAVDWTPTHESHGVTFQTVAFRGTVC